MVINFLRRLFGKKEVNSLFDLDDLYRKTIVHLPHETRLHYCKNLIARCQYDLKEGKDKTEIRRLEVLIQASESEIEKLNKI